MFVPCKNCNDREYNCHSVCVKYSHYKMERDRIIQAKKIDYIKRAKTLKIPYYKNKT